MRLASSLLLSGALAMAVLALSAGSASAQLEVHQEDGGVPCGTVTVNEEHDVSGGCHAEFVSEEHIPLVGYTPDPVILFQCNWHFSAQIGEDGEGYVTEAVLTDESPPTNPPCTREPCDEGEADPHPHAMIPWPIHINEAVGEVVSVEFCLRNGSAVGGEEGDPQSRCEIHMPLTDNGNHDYEIGDNAEYFCEVSPAPFPVSLRDVHFTNEGEDEDVEIIH